MQVLRSVSICVCVIAASLFKNDNLNTKNTALVTINYNQFKETVHSEKHRLVKLPAKDSRAYLFKLINEDIYNYWEGTPWAFSGTTRQPKEGSIACGYFVTNTLSDLGFKIDRVALAEAVSAVMIKKLCVGIQSFNSLDKLNNYLDKQPVNSVFIIGLDFHTGYVVKTTTGNYFFHSNYIKKEGVIKEKIDASRALANNKFFMIGSLSANNALLRNWVEDQTAI